MNNKKISVVIPVLNEISNIELLLPRLEKVFKKLNISSEIIIVDDGSRDSEIECYKKIRRNFTESRLQILILGTNHGHQKALEIGIKHAQGDYIVTMDGDLQDPPEFLYKLISEIQEGNLDFVATIRASRETSLINKFLIFLFYKIIAFLIGEKVIANSGDFRIAKKKVYEMIFRISKPYYFFRFEINKMKFKKKYLVYHQNKRTNEIAKGRFIWYLDFAFQAIVSSSNKLHKKALLFSVILFLLFFIFTLIFFVLFLLKKVSALILMICLVVTIVNVNTFLILLILDYIVFNHLSTSTNNVSYIRKI